MFLQRKKVKSLKALACLPEAKRRDLLKSMSDAQYEELNQRLRLFPEIDLSVNCKVEDDEEDGLITCGSLINVKVLLKRKTLGERMDEAENGQVEVRFDDQLKPLTFGDTKEALEKISPGANTDQTPVSRYFCHFASNTHVFF